MFSSSKDTAKSPEAPWTFCWIQVAPPSIVRSITGSLEPLPDPTAVPAFVFTNETEFRVTGSGGPRRAARRLRRQTESRSQLHTRKGRVPLPSSFRRSCEQSGCRPPLRRYSRESSRPPASSPSTNETPDNGRSLPLSCRIQLEPPSELVNADARH